MSLLQTITNNALTTTSIYGYYGRHDNFCVLYNDTTFLIYGYGYYNTFLHKLDLTTNTFGTNYSNQTLMGTSGYFNNGFIRVNFAIDSTTRIHTYTMYRWDINGSYITPELTGTVQTVPSNGPNGHTWTHTLWDSSTTANNTYAYYLYAYSSSSTNWTFQFLRWNGSSISILQTIVRSNYTFSATLNCAKLYNDKVYYVGATGTSVVIWNTTTNTFTETFAYGTYSTANLIRDIVVYNNSIYISNSYGVYIYSQNLQSYSLFYSGDAVFMGVYNAKLYLGMYYTKNINIVALPVQPSVITAFDPGNTVVVSSGNLKVSFIDTTNIASNNVYYYYSLDNTTFINSNIKNNGPTQTNYSFYVNTSTIRGNIYIYAYNVGGVSNTLSTPITVYITPNSLSNCYVSSVSSGNINVSITETSPSTYYYLNGVSYWYYLYTTGTNQSSNIVAYSQGASMNSSYTTNFVIQNLPANNYRVYLLAKNTVGNSAPFLSTSANVAVFTVPLSPDSYSLSFDVNTGITVSITDTRNTLINKVVYYYYYYYRVGDTAPNQSTDIAVYSNSYVPVVNGQTSYSFTIKGLQPSYYNVYIAAKNSIGSTIYSPVIAPVNVICFKEDSRILTNRGYRKIQYLKRGDLIKTFNDGFKPIYKIGKKEIMHVPSLEKRTKDQLYKCSPTEYPELFEDLVLTGCHSILVDEFADDEEREQTRKINGGIYVTDKKYRLPVCVDHRASVYEKEGKYSVYHIALENDDYYMNYGIYANGLLVESTSKRFLDEYKVMETQNIHTNTKTIATQYSNLLTSGRMD